MRNLLKADLIAIVPEPVKWVPGPLQASLGRCPWRVAVASMLLCRTRRAQAEPVALALFQLWPDASSLAVSETEELQELIRPCGLTRQRARQLQRFSVGWLWEGWETIDQLTGVGAYVSDAVGLFCLARTDLESEDLVLRQYAEKLLENGLPRERQVHDFLGSL